MRFFSNRSFRRSGVYILIYTQLLQKIKIESKIDRVANFICKQRVAGKHSMHSKTKANVIGLLMTETLSWPRLKVSSRTWIIFDYIISNSNKSRRYTFQYTLFIYCRDFPSTFRIYASNCHNSRYQVQSFLTLEHSMWIYFVFFL